MKIVIFASGTGSNAENLIKYAKESELEIAALVCDRPLAPVAIKSRAAQLKTFIIPFEKLDNIDKSKKQHEEKIIEALKVISFDWICLAGYMRILTSSFISEFFCHKLGFSKIINIHPSLLPSFKGKNAYELAFQSGVVVSGITIHLVAAEIDSGPILMQESFLRESSDTLEEFKARGLELEHRLYKKLLNQLQDFDPYMKNDSKFIFWRKKCV